MSNGCDYERCRDVMKEVLRGLEAICPQKVTGGLLIRAIRASGDYETADCVERLVMDGEYDQHAVLLDEYFEYDRVLLTICVKADVLD